MSISNVAWIIRYRMTQLSLYVLVELKRVQVKRASKLENVTFDPVLALSLLTHVVYLRHYSFYILYDRHESLNA